MYCLEHFEGVYQILNIVFEGIKLFTYESTDCINYNLAFYEIWCHIIIIELTLLLFGTGCIGRINLHTLKVIRERTGC